ncbi:MAG: apolipoprotein N-acyltransferase, partial [Acidobacteriota bacterium]
FTWTGPASAFVDCPWLMNSLPVWGATGLAWWAVAMSSALWGFFQFDTRRSAALALGFSVVAVVVATAVAPTAEPAGEPLQVTVRQPGTSLEEKWDPSQAGEIADRVWAMTAETAVRGAELVLWPESAVPYRLDVDPAYREMVEQMAERMEVEIILNAIAAIDDGRYANSAYLVNGDGVSRLAFTDSLVREVGGFSPGEEPVVMPARVPLGIAICFEVVFPDLPVREVRRGAQLLVTLTNDGWYGFSWAPHQHFAQVRLRAAETRRWFARAALTGISGFVDPAGKVVSQLAVGQTGALAESVQPMTGLTPRVRFGDWWAILCGAAVVAILLLSRFTGKRRVRKRLNV